MGFINFNDIHVEFYLYLTMGNFDGDLTEEEINLIINLVVDKNKNYANRGIIEQIFNEAFNWWIDGLKKGETIEVLKDKLPILDNLDNDEKISIVLNMQNIMDVDGREDESEVILLQSIAERWDITLGK
jgi:hypothetical protein